MDFDIGTEFTINEYEEAYQYIISHNNCTIGVKTDTGNTQTNTYIIEEIPSETPEQIARNRIAKLKDMLSDTDYQSIKHSEGALSDEEWEPIRLQRIQWRAEINQLEEQYGL